MAKTGKKRVQYLTFNDLVVCADLMISNWTVGSTGKLYRPYAINPPALRLARRECSI